MELRARIRPLARRAAFTAALGALLVPVGTATVDAAKRSKKSKRYPVVTSVRPMDANVGETIVIRGRNFKRGKNKNTVVFKRSGARAVFAKSTLGTARQIRVVVPDSLRRVLPDNTSARFQLRVLSRRFSKRFTSVSRSPVITALPKPVEAEPGTPGAPARPGGSPAAPAPAPAPAPVPARVCRGDEDGDMLDSELENSLGLDACKADTDEDGVPDGYEYQSARDLNDDEYQQPNTYLPYPGKRPYPNPLDKDAETDYDGDGLPLMSEYRLWDEFGARPAGTLPRDDYRLLYSDGEQYSLSERDSSGRRRPTQRVETYAKSAEFLSWASGNGYNPVMIRKSEPWHGARTAYDIRDANLNGVPDGPRTTHLHGELFGFDTDNDGFVSDDERDEDADGLTNIDELRRFMLPAFWEECYAGVNEKAYPVKYQGTDLVKRDTDGDGIVDGADDQDHDDIPNVMELSRHMASEAGHIDWDPHDGQCIIDDSIPLVGPDGPDPDDLPDPLEEYHPNDYGRVNPFNPCLPYEWSRTCAQSGEFGKGHAPFDGSTNWFALQ